MGLPSKVTTRLALVLEDYERARARGATIYAEVAGFGTNADGNHVTQPQSETMRKADKRFINAFP